METIYSAATKAIKIEIDRYLKLIEDSNSFDNLTPDIFRDRRVAELFAAGIEVFLDEHNDDPGDFLINEFNRKSALKFDVETAITNGVYIAVRSYVEKLFDLAYNLTDNFSVFKETDLQSFPSLIPIYQNILGLSKAQLIKKVGSISDNNLSKPASNRLAAYLNQNIVGRKIDKLNVLQRIEITIEGIVRDLVGRIVFEEVVASSLKNAGVQFLRENEYGGISGVVYDIRADFVIPNEKQPIAFIEVRKSSSRHASLYAKDKMFSAINWKGKHKNLIGVIIVEGDWTQASLKAMSTVFDYVVPLEKCNELAKNLKKASDGDQTILKWLINFSIEKSEYFV